MKFSDIRNGDSILTLEQDRRSQFPIFDIAKVQKISQPTYQRMEDNSMVQVVTMTVTDTTGTFNIVVPLDREDTIYDKIYFTTNPNLIVQEIMVQKSRAQDILSNVDRYKAIDAECDKILARLMPNQPNTRPVANPEINPEFMQRFSKTEDMVEKIYQALFPPKQPATAKNKED